jgi:hypothetical protein
MTEEQRKKGQEEWRAAHPAPPPALSRAAAESYTLPQGYNDTSDHLANFFRAVETRERVMEDEVFGNHAAIGCHMANYSYGWACILNQDRWPRFRSRMRERTGLWCLWVAPGWDF